MTVRTRFAPSPTGLLHIGGARTALYSYLYAKSLGGEFILRVEDTDLERSKREYEEKQIEDLKWLGIIPTEGVSFGGEYGPYRQSERLDIYKKYAWELVDSGKAYPCFLSQAELEKLSEKAVEEKNAPHLYHGKFRDYDLAEAKKRIDAGEEYVIRFKNPKKSYTFTDIVRGEVTFPEDMVGDFVVIRSNGLPVYNFCCVIDDHLMKISHVIRAEEHLPNTVRQLMIYEAIGAELPVFSHVSLLVGEDRQKLSKRHGATSVLQYKEQDFLPKALINYLCLLGWSHPDETDIFDINELGAIFDLKRFNKAPALYDIEKLKFFNEMHLRQLTNDELIAGFSSVLDSDNIFNTQTIEWKNGLCELYRDKIQIFSDIKSHILAIFNSDVDKTDSIKEVLSWETTPSILDYVSSKVDETISEGRDFISSDQFSEIQNHLKKELKIKGKPLFMGLRVVLTCQEHGPDLKQLIPLTPVEIIKERITKLR